MSLLVFTLFCMPHHRLYKDRVFFFLVFPSELVKSTVKVNISSRVKTQIKKGTYSFVHVKCLRI